MGSPTTGEPKRRTAVKLSIVGAGSAVFSLQIVRDLCATPSLSGSEIVLMDIDSDRLDAVTSLATRCADEMGSDVSFVSTLSEDAALEDAEFVVNVAYASGHKHGMRVQETTSQSGYYHSSAGVYGPVDHWAFDDLMMRLDFARTMERRCPDAWLLQSGNPVFEGCTLMTRETDIKVVGLCDGVKTYRDVCDVLGIEAGRVTWEAPGVNHQVWLTKFLLDDMDIYPLLDEWIESSAESYWQSHRQLKSHDIQMSRAAIHLYQLYGLMPLGDTVRDPINAWLHTDFATKLRWFGEPWGGPDTPQGRQAFIDLLDGRVRDVERIVSDPLASVVTFLDSLPSYEMHVPIIDALAGNRSGVFQVNVRNDGSLAGIADDVVVELRALVDGSGVHPISIAPLPRKIMLEQTLPAVLRMEHTLEVLKTGDLSMLMWSALMHPQTTSYEQARDVLSDLLAMEGNDRLNEHHRWPGETTKRRLP
ncbi:MAG: alpha-glucosidase/alpha-galactosidase [Acidimicrobiia bacterium]|nr:MAG: alpha-glucosidase/alpha-galactosidase [Acidimicrobiia bacterium]